MADFVEAVNARGEKQIIPAHWLDHPVLGKGFRLPRRLAAGGMVHGPIAPSTLTSGEIVAPVVKSRKPRSK